MGWIVKDVGFNKGNIELFGSKFSIGNGYMGYRGTLEEYSKNELVACTLSGLFDKKGNGWREPVNAPNALLTRVYCDGELLSVLYSKVEAHEQVLDMASAVHKRRSVFVTGSGVRVAISSERFASIIDIHLMATKYTIEADRDVSILVETGIDAEIWDINGPHLEHIVLESKDRYIYASSDTCELGCNVSVAEWMNLQSKEQKIVKEGNTILRRTELQLKAREAYTFEKYASVYKTLDGASDSLAAAIQSIEGAKCKGYDQLYDTQEKLWGGRWEQAGIRVEGDEYAQLSIRYSIYLLMISAPFHTDKVAIPARGLSGQVYKGAMFWDTEIYMLPFFCYSMPQVARNLVMYRVNTLEGARKKAAEYGYRGAFYAWESQETGEDNCTHFNLNDIFTGRPMRTYFRDKQVHISADVVYGIWMYYIVTGDESILLDGGAEVILECARFFYSYSYFKKEKNRYEILDVTGADEYHERVNNNAYTNAMVKHTLECATAVLEKLRDKYPDKYAELVQKLDYTKDIEHIRDMNELLYVPSPNPANGLIEQFDGYFGLEGVSLEELKSRIILPNEYLGSPNGLSVNTQILKQADVVLMLYIFRKKYADSIKKANWIYYEPRTEHGSSLSTCIYALLSSEIGNLEWAYEFFLKAATIDLIGNYKLYLGDLYIGGTHPAANGGSWMVAVLGFGGLDAGGERIRLNPRLPEKWDSLSFNFSWKSQRLYVTINKGNVEIKSDAGNTVACSLEVYGNQADIQPGETRVVGYKNLPMN